MNLKPCLICLTLFLTACSHKPVLKDGSCAPVEKDGEVIFVCNDDEVMDECQFVEKHAVSVCKKR